MSSIVRRSVTSVSWNITAQIVAVAVGFVRSVLLARLLDVDTFGIYAGALAVVGLSAVLSTLGIPGAFLHRAPETIEENHAAAVYLSMQVALTGIWLAVMLVCILIFTSGQTLVALVVITVTTGMEQITNVPNYIHIRRVVHRRLALLNTINVIAVALVTVGMAWLGFELWALLAGEFTTTVILVVGLFIWRPIWRAWMTWDWAVVRYYVRFGLPTMAATMLSGAMEKVDDIFVRYRLGVTDMGFYSRAYTFATYPRSILTTPVSAVAGGTFAELVDNRVQLSKAFFRSNALIVRAGFFLSGWLILIAPEFVTILLGDKWLPMVPIFRLLSVFALLDPLRDVMGTLFVAVGQPQRLVRYRLVQFGVLVVGLATLGTAYGAVGVAIAVDAMLVVGIVILVSAARPWVDFSPRKLFLWPAVAVVLGMIAVIAVVYLTTGVGAWMTSPWLSAIVKSAAWGLVYGGVMVLAERNEMRDLWSMVRRGMGRAQ